jgi:hypothetical protein
MDKSLMMSGYYSDLGTCYKYYSFVNGSVNVSSLSFFSGFVRVLI